jgi:hypothetical protein
MDFTVELCTGLRGADTRVSRLVSTLLLGWAIPDSPVEHSLDVGAPGIEMSL